MGNANYSRFADKIDDHKFIIDNIYAALLLLDTMQLGPQIKIEWSNKMKTTAGTASGKIITISNKLWLAANEEQRKELIIHETCHLVNYEINKDIEHYSHGKEWQDLMRRCGYYNPQRCHTIPVIRNKKRYFLYTCGCENGRYVHKIKVRTHNLIQKCKHGERLVCNVCKKDCVFTKREIKES